MSASITEAHRKLAYELMHMDDRLSAFDHRAAAQLIADSEANAVAAAVTALTCIHHNDLERAACPVCLVTALTAERDQLRAALALGQQNCDDAYDDLRAERDAAIARAERAEAELAAERARLDWVFQNCKVEANDYTTGNRDVYYVHDREDLGAAMKEDAK